MRERLRAVSAVDYQVERHNSDWSDHIARTHVTAGMVAWLEPKIVADPACGDASIASSAYVIRPYERAWLNDISVKNAALAVKSVQRGVLPFDTVVTHDDIMSALGLLEAHQADVVILTEILEHVDDPDTILAFARLKGKMLVASSPVTEIGQRDDNEEHLWQFDNNGYQEMLIKAGWDPTSLTNMTFSDYLYRFQIWTAR
jgi:hypothetical protein